MHAKGDEIIIATLCDGFQRHYTLWSVKPKLMRHSADTVQNLHRRTAETTWPRKIPEICNTRRYIILLVENPNIGGTKSLLCILRADQYILEVLVSGVLLIPFKHFWSPAVSIQTLMCRARAIFTPFISEQTVRSNSLLRCSTTLSFNTTFSLFSSFPSETLELFFQCHYENSVKGFQHKLSPFYKCIGINELVVV